MDIPIDTISEAHQCFFVVVQLLSRVQLCATPRTAAHQASLSFTISQNLFKLMSSESVILSNQLIFCSFFSSCLQSFPALGSFPRSWLFAWGGQSIGASASVFLINIQCWFSLGLTGLSSLLSKGLSRVLEKMVWMILKGCGWLWPVCCARFVTSRGEDFDPGLETRLDHSELFV